MQELDFQMARCAKDIFLFIFIHFDVLIMFLEVKLYLVLIYPKIVFNGLICQIFFLELFIPKYLDIYIYKKKS